MCANALQDSFFILAVFHLSIKADKNGSVTNTLLEIDARHSYEKYQNSTSLRK